MKKPVAAILIAVVSFILIGFVILAVQQDEAAAPEAVPDTAAQDAVDDTPATPADGTSTDPGDNPGEVQTSSVEIKNFAFAPTKVTVKKGTKVTWTNQDTTQHDVTPDNPTAEFKASELLSRGESYSVTFNTPGTYTYFCSPHPEMQGTIEVTE